jgi:hypothetical protein
VDDFTKRRLNDEAVLRSQQRASYRKPSHALLDYLVRTGRPSAARQPINDRPNDAMDPGKSPND